MSYLKMVESRVAEAMAQGAFSGLAGEGKPLDLARDAFAGDLWMAHHILENEGLLPPWLQLGKDIERGLEGLAELDRRHAALVEAVANSGDWPGSEAALVACRSSYEAAAREVRRLQDQFNLEAPGIRSERPGIWVDFHLARLDERVDRARGLPPASR